jgi:hypothetical protein
MLLGTLVTLQAASGETWVSVSADGRARLEAGSQSPSPAVAVNELGAAGFDVTLTVNGLAVQPVKTKGGEFVEVGWGEQSRFGAVGEPAVPVVRRLFVVPNGASVTVSSQAGAAVEIGSEVANVALRVVPVQPPIEKIPGAREQAEFQMKASAYALDAATPGERVKIEEVGMVRGQRLFLLEARPVAYNAQEGVLSVWPAMQISVRFSEGSGEVSGLSALPGLKSIVLNPGMVPTLKSRGSGNYLIIAASAYTSAISSFANAKEAQGFTVTTHTAESTAAAIKSYIQSLWGGASAPDYILLVGDTDTIPMWTGGGEGSPSTDLPYACMDGSSDWYPDIAIGRFSVRTTTQLTAIVNKTLLYENGPLPDPTYLKRAVFMASEDNYTVSEGTHNWVIVNYMIPNGFTSLKLYTHTYSATTAQVSAAFNAGQVYGIYSGHGGELYWADGPVFQQSHVNALTNVGMYPLVYSFACVTGTLTVDECFMETWQRAANKGGVIAIGSSVNSYWTEDDVLEKRLFDSIYDTNDSVEPEVGPVWNDAKMRYLAEMGTGATTRRYFEMYNILGDPALEYPGNCPDAGTVALDRAKYQCQSTMNIVVSDCGLNANDQQVETVTVSVVSTSEPAGEQVVLTETDPDSAEFEGSISLSTVDAAGVLLVAPNDTVTVTYIDADDGQGGTNVVVTENATVDCTAPMISNVQVTNLQARSASVTFAANEDVRGIIHYGLSCGSLTLTASSGGYSSNPQVDLTALSDNTPYFFTVEAEDQAGNVVEDTNGGACYTFTTPEIPDFFTEIFTSSDNDLDNKILKFTPNASSDFYAGCAEAITSLPTDPAGGTTIGSWTGSADDGYAQVSLTGGQTVKLYGVSYGTIYVGTNGYITFDHGESGYTESTTAHFTLAEVAALYDDLNPGQGGSVSYRQLADRLAVTWLNVPEHSAGNQNTFQIEMFFDGKITVSYLAIAALDGLAGLSAGGGQDPAFTETDLTTMGACGPRPPAAQNVSASTAVGTMVQVTLSGTDDGLPNPPGVLSYVISGLPSHGSLSDPNGGAIGSVPYTLLSNAKKVNYLPVAGYRPSDTFKFKVNDGGTPPAGGDSNEATATVSIGGSAWDPVAYNVSQSVPMSVPTNVTLNAVDPNGDPLSYVIKSLPVSGTGLLFDPNGGQITTVPYTLLGGGKVVRYMPPFNQTLSASWSYAAADATVESNAATVSLTVGAAVSQMIHEWPMDSNPGWSKAGAWAFGVPTGGGSHGRDPTSGYTGTNVYGYNLNGDYSNSMSTTRYLTTTAFGCSNTTGVELRFRRWMGVEGSPGNDHASIEVSNNGSTWTTVWENGTSTVNDSAWVLRTYSLSSVADNQGAVYVRWGMGPTDSSTSYPGWNIDDVQIWGVVHNTCGGVVLGDMNDDGLVNGADMQRFVEVLLNPYSGVAFAEFCAGDMNADGFMTTADADLFVDALLNP